MPYLFSHHNNEEYRKSMADQLPNGDAFNAKNIPASFLFKLLLGLSADLSIVLNTINAIAYEYDIFTTSSLINEWEAALGIPDTAFDNSGDIELRRKQCRVKLGWSFDTRQSFVNAIKYLFGIDCVIHNGSYFNSLYPLIYPFMYWDTPLDAFYTLIIDLPVAVGVDVYPLTYPFTYSDYGSNIEAFFYEITPAHCSLIFRYIL